ncbi:MAG: hypothetical protein KDN20_20520 [Verrucomicrobiae bacterium]|nr:hypothetical protein [Verrucomicrobiae bacterium]
MKSKPLPLIPTLLFSGMLTVACGLGAPNSEGGPGEEPTGPKKPREFSENGRSKPDGRGDDQDPFRNLTPEQRDQLREAVRKAWSDPSVLEARDKLKTAAESYQDALSAAIKRSSPGLTDTIDVLRRDSSSELKIYGSMDRVPGGPSGPGGGPNGPGGRDWRGFEGYLTMENPSFLRDLDSEKQVIYKAAHKKAMETPEVKNQLDSLKALRQSDDEIRKARINAIRDVHQSIREAMIQADPRIKALLPEPRRSGETEKGPNREKSGRAAGPDSGPKPPRAEN